MSAEIDGKKKYSPPFGITNSGTVNVSFWLRGSSPPTVRGVVWPMIGSIPGVIGLEKGKLQGHQHPAQAKQDDENTDFALFAQLICWNLNPFPIIDWYSTAGTVSRLAQNTLK